MQRQWKRILTLFIAFALSGILLAACDAGTTNEVDLGADTGAGVVDDTDLGTEDETDLGTEDGADLATEDESDFAGPDEPEGVVDEDEGVPLEPEVVDESPGAEEDIIVSEEVTGTEDLPDLDVTTGDETMTDTEDLAGDETMTATAVPTSPGVVVEDEDITGTEDLEPPLGIVNLPQYILASSYEDAVLVDETGEQVGTATDVLVNNRGELEFINVTTSDNATFAVPADQVKVDFTVAEGEERTLGYQGSLEDLRNEVELDPGLFEDDNPLVDTAAAGLITGSESLYELDQFEQFSVTTTGGEALGQVDDFVVNPDESRVANLAFDRNDGQGAVISPFDRFRFDPNANAFTTDATAEDFGNAPELDPTLLESDQAFESNFDAETDVFDEFGS